MCNDGPKVDFDFGLKLRSQFYLNNKMVGKNLGLRGCSTGFCRLKFWLSSVFNQGSTTRKARRGNVALHGKVLAIDFVAEPPITTQEPLTEV